jgi:3-dehydroquinate synthase
VSLGDTSYEVVLGGGLLGDLAELVAHYCPAPRYAVVSDSTVAPLYAKGAAAALETLAPTLLLQFPAGEWNKTRETWATLTDQLLAARLDRDAAIVAVGGGVVGDLAGFVAATYLRGVRYIQVPTTLLAMIDSAIGGKTGVDTQLGKNLVGAFHQPGAVIADVETLNSLPPLQLAAGMAEALKHGAIADRSYFERLLSGAEAVRAREPEVLRDAVRRSIEIKVGVVAEDERERGRRAVLNFGHTVAHALEATQGYELLHGEAVAVGMLAEARLGEKIGVTEEGVAREMAGALECYGLPLSPPAEPDRERMLEVMRQDKKNRDGTVRFALPSSLGQMARGPSGEWTVSAPEEVVSEVLREIGDY